MPREASCTQDFLFIRESLSSDSLLEFSALTGSSAEMLQTFGRKTYGNKMQFPVVFIRALKFLETVARAVHTRIDFRSSQSRMRGS